MGEPASSPSDADFAAAQLLSRSIAMRFRESAGHRRATAAFADCDAKSSADLVAERAADLLSDDDWPAMLLAPLLEGLAANDWFDPPIRASRDALRIGALLFDCPAVSISAAILSADALRAMPPQSSFVVPGRLSIMRYWQSGGAQLRRWYAGPADADFSAATAPRCVPIDAVRLEDGMLVRADGRTTGQMLVGAKCDVITLTAMIRAEASPFTREYAVSSGALVRVAALDDRGSRGLMLLALLRNAGRVDAGDCFEETTHDPAFFVRWQAMREWLALDARAALPRLRAMTDDPNAEIRAAAREMIARVEARIACPA